VPEWDPEVDGESPLAVRVRISSPSGGGAVEVLTRILLPADLAPTPTDRADLPS
jgi:hypothetical protein